ncbi:hypothetical protein GF319_15300 [Candidatus Bathyarchaeota archaeon]|nr:hypothetical protein [Candidatus Bathyarchaeota archaeon]
MNLKSEKSYLVAKYLLLNRATSQTEISQNTQVAVGYVNEVVHYLSDLDIVRIDYGETRLVDYARLLDKISLDRSFKRLIKETIRLPASNIAKTEDMVSSYCKENNIRHAFTGFSGLRRYYEYHINYPMVHVYVQNHKGLNNLEKGEGITPVIILKTDRPDIMSESVTVNNLTVCGKIQVIIDLYSSGIGRDAAIKSYRDLIWKTGTY